MGKLERIGVAIDSDLLKRFDGLSGERGYSNRSEAFRDLIRDQLVGQQTTAPNAMIVGSITLIYDHHASGLSDKLTDLQHQFHELVVSTTHAHLDHDSCLEVLIVRGRGREVERFADRLIGLKGVVHGKLVKSVPATEVGGAKRNTHSHPHKH